MELYTLEQAAELLGISRAQLGRIIRAGKLRVARLGHRTIRLSEEAIADYVRSQETTGPHYQPTRPKEES